MCSFIFPSPRLIKTNKMTMQENAFVVFIRDTGQVDLCTPSQTPRKKGAGVLFHESHINNSCQDARPTITTAILGVTLLVRLVRTRT